MAVNITTDEKIQKMRERLKRMEKNIAERRCRNEAKVKCYLATGFLKKLGLDDITKTMDDARTCSAFCEFVTKSFVEKINVSNSSWREAAVNYIDNYNKQNDSTSD